MNSLFPSRCIIMSSILGLLDIACIEAEIDPIEPLSLRTGQCQGNGGLPSTVPGDPERGVWINNGLHDPDVSGIDPAYALSSSLGLSEDSELLLDSERRDTVRYLVECALPQGHDITKLVDGEWLIFDGAVGLAPEWEDEECDEDCQEWVTACMLARTNISGQTVSIWMRADHPTIGDGMSPQFPAYEASFFGNLFADSPSQHFCQGTVAGAQLGQLAGRTCAELSDESCGFTKYTNCPQEPRCSFPTHGKAKSGPMHSVVGCIGGSLATGHSFHTISTYVGPL